MKVEAILQAVRMAWTRMVAVAGMRRGKICDIFSRWSQQDFLTDWIQEREKQSVKGDCKIQQLNNLFAWQYLHLDHWLLTIPPQPHFS